MKIGLFGQIEYFFVFQKGPIYGAFICHDKVLVKTKMAKLLIRSTEQLRPKNSSGSHLVAVAPLHLQSDDSEEPEPRGLGVSGPQRVGRGDGEARHRRGRGVGGGRHQHRTDGLDEEGPHGLQVLLGDAELLVRPAERLQLGLVRLWVVYAGYEVTEELKRKGVMRLLLL